ncbi:MAG: hypothetical protein IPL55_02860 [Saprospiraceae bacterium]|nr:hypothetical protein [Saprospiraceae bacterium]
MNVLSLHKMGHPDDWRESVRSLEFMFKECRPELNCILHDANLPFPDKYKKIEFHLIVLGPTFLCSRYNSSTFKKILNNFDFIRNSKAYKVALPQDDYDCAGILDKWMVDWSVNVLYSVCPNNWDILYPKFINLGKIKLGYTGYVSKEWINKWSEIKPNTLRHVDISYRASKLPANFGSVGNLKSEIADTFLKSLPKDHKFKLDISTDKAKTISGSKWHEFLENSKFCLTTPSGSSIYDPYGKIRNMVKEYSTKFPQAKFEEIENACFQNLDSLYTFTAISPRNLEAGLAETVQIATPGSYSDLMKPLKHYIPLNSDCSNIKDVLLMISNQSLIDDIKVNWKRNILQNKRLLRENIVSEILELAEEYYNENKILIELNSYHVKLIEKYEDNMRFISYAFYTQMLIRKSLEEMYLIRKLKDIKALVHSLKMF